MERIVVFLFAFKLVVQLTHETHEISA